MNFQKRVGTLTNAKVRLVTWASPLATATNPMIFLDFFVYIGRYYTHVLIPPPLLFS